MRTGFVTCYSAVLPANQPLLEWTSMHQLMLESSKCAIPFVALEAAFSGEVFAFLTWHTSLLVNYLSVGSSGQSTYFSSTTGGSLVSLLSLELSLLFLGSEVLVANLDGSAGQILMLLKLFGMFFYIYIN